MDSVLSQDFPDFEVLVLDDGSTDETRAVAEGIDDRRVRVEANPRNLGIPASRNRCLALARGDYIAWLDSDDLMAPRRLSRQVRCLDRHPDIATLGGWARTFHDDGRRGKLLAKPSRHRYLTPWLLFRCCHANTTLMGRAEVMRSIGYREAFRVSEDYDFSVRLTARHRVANLPAVLSLQRQHAGRTTAGSSDLGFATKCQLATAQFERLGLAADDRDLAFHYTLTRLGRDDLRSAGFVDRAADWLGRIAAANRRSKALDADALADVLQAVWTQITVKRIAACGLAEGLRGHRRFARDGRLLRLMAANLGPSADLDRRPR